MAEKKVKQKKSPSGKEQAPEKRSGRGRRREAAAGEKEKAPVRRSGRGQKPARDWRVLRIVMGLVFLVLAVYSLVSLVSYIFTWSKDQSLLTAENFFSDETIAYNSGGKLGVLWADFLVSKLFGFGAFTVPLFLGAISLFCLKIKRVNLLRVFIICLLGAILFSIAFSYVFHFFDHQSLLGNGPGGSYGHAVALWLNNLLGAFGTGCVLFVALFLWAVLLSRKVAWWFDEQISLTSRRFSQAGEKAVEASPVTAEEPDPESFTGAVGEIPAVDFLVSGEESPLLPGYEVELTVDAPASGISFHDSGAADSIPPDFGEEPADDLPWDMADAGIPSGGSAQAGTGPEGGASDPDNVPLSVEESENDFLGNLSESDREHLFNPRLDLPDYQMPPVSFLEDYRNLWHEVSRDELERNKQRIVNALANYKIGVVGITARMGPTVTLYKIRLAEGVKIAQVRRLEEDIAMSIGAKGVRVVTLLDSVGIEVPNDHPSVVPLKSVLNAPQFQEAKMELPLALGITVTNEPFFLDLAKMPHLLVAGATGMGKSVGLNCIIASLLYTKHPAEMKLVMVDPKKVEFSLHAKLEKHYLAKLPDYDDAIITDTKNVVTTLKSLCVEMDERYELLKKADVRQLKDYNAKYLARTLNPLKGHKFLPYIVVIIDEFADLLMVAGREIEEPIARLAQKARAVGIHLVIATQRPTTDIITGTIKANFNSRIAFRVNSGVDSKTIIDGPGANRLIGRGDMLVIHPGADIDRVQCALIDTPEIIRINKFINEQRGYDHAFYLPEYEEEGEEDSSAEPVDMRRRDKLFAEAAKIVVQYQQGSASILQRKLGLGYNRAGRLIDQLEAAGIVGRSEGSKARSVLVSDFETLDRKLESLDQAVG